MYPFAPSAEAARPYLGGILDAFFVVQGAGGPGPYDESSSASSTSQSSPSSLGLSTTSQSSDTSASSATESSTSESSATLSESSASSLSSPSSPSSPSSGSMSSSSSESSASTPSSSSSSGPYHHPYFAMLHLLQVAPSRNIYTFYGAVDWYAAKRGDWYKMTFEVERSRGIVRVAAPEQPCAALVVDSNLMYGVTGEYVLDAEVEPARLLWQVAEVRSLRLANEYREHDPRVRAASVAGQPDKTVLYLHKDGDVLRLRDGYNCGLDYDEATATLTVSAGPGLGKGLPAEIPWDSAVPDLFDGVMTINGQNVGGNVELRCMPSLTPEYGPAAMTIHIRED